MSHFLRIVFPFCNAFRTLRSNYVTIDNFFESESGSTFDIFLILVGIVNEMK